MKKSKLCEFRRKFSFLRRKVYCFQEKSVFFITQRQSEVLEQQSVSFSQFILLFFNKELFKFSYKLQYRVHSSDPEHKYLSAVSARTGEGRWGLNPCTLSLSY